MSYITFEGIHKYGKDTCPLRTLVDILQKISTDRPTCILEIALLNKFPETNEFFSKKLFSPRWIIEYMMKMHGDTMEKISAVPEYLSKLIYKYKCDNEQKEYVFSNNMTFYADIITICYLYYIIKTYKYTKLRLVRNLFRIMKMKYIIHDDLNIYKPWVKHNDPKRITWLKIAHSFPSITFAMLYHDIIDVPLFLYSAFSNFNLSKTLCLSLFASIIPPLDDTPLALFLAIAVFNDQYKQDKHMSTDKMTPLYELWKYIFELYTSNIFPTCLKLELCKKWDIIYMVKNEYKFSPYFRATRQIAKKLILTLRPNDQYLKCLLANI